MSPRTTAVWWIVMKFGVWGVPPGRGGSAPQASLHNTADETVGLTTGTGVTAGAGSGLAIALVGAMGLDAEDELGPAAGAFEQAPTVATARLAVPASWSNRRRLSFRPTLDGSGGNASMRSRYAHPCIELTMSGFLYCSCGITSAASRSICSRSSATLVPTGFSRTISAPASMTSRTPRATSSGVPDTGTCSIPGMSP